MTKRAWVVLVSVVVGIFLVVLLGIGVVAAASLGRIARAGGDWAEQTLQGSGRNKVAVINVSGEIHGGESTPSLFGTGGAGARDITSQIRQAIEDDDVAAVIVRVDSPGGAVVASDDIARAVRRLRSDKPVVASMGDLAASGGYYIASQAERVLANPGTITGSIGVIAILPNLEGAADKLGIEPVVLKSGEFKDAASPFREMTETDRAIYQRLLDQAYDQFVDAVATGREMEESEVRELADGRPYSGADARENGLVDDFGDLDEAYDVALDLAQLTRREASLVEYRRQRGFGGLFPFGFGGGSVVEEVKRELGLGLGLKYLYLP